MRARRRLARLVASGPEPIADGVWIVRGGFPGKTMNVYLVRDGHGVLVFDAGIAAMTRAVALAGAQLGGITRVVLGHGHPDHRGGARGAPPPPRGRGARGRPPPPSRGRGGRAAGGGGGGRHYFRLEELDP